MADEMVTIRIRVAGNPRDIRQFSNEMTRLAAQSKLTSSKITTTDKAMGGLNQRIKEWNKNHKILSKLAQGLIGIFDKLGKLTVKLGTIGFAVVLASLSALTAAFWLGNLAVKAYRATMAGLAAVTAAAIAAVAAFAAAQRELNAATNAYTNKSAPALGSAFNQSRAALRSLHSDAQLASAGMQALNATFAAVSKNASFDAKAQKALRALDDFASAGGDRGKNLAAAGEFYGLLEKNISQGKLGLSAEIEAAGKAISPAFEKGLKEFKKKGGAKNLKTLREAILTGQFAEMGGVAGQAEAVNETLISVLKGYFTRVQALFADLGQPLLKPIKEAADRIFKIIRDTMFRIAPEVEGFAQGTLLDTLINGFEKIADFFVKLMREWLPKSQGMLKGWARWWSEFLYGWNEITKRLQGAVAAGREVNRIFGPVLLNVFKRLGDMFKNTQSLIASNEDKFQSLANSINNILTLISSMYSWFTEALVSAAPAIEAITSAFLVLADAIGSVLELVQALANMVIPGGAGSALGGLAQIILLMTGGGLLKQFAKGGFAGGGLKGAIKNTGVGRVATGAAQAGKAARGGASKGASSIYTTVTGRGGGRIITGTPIFGTGGIVTGGGGISGAMSRGRGRIITMGQPSGSAGAFGRGYGRARDAGAGIFSSTARGARGKYMSITKGNGLFNPSMGRMVGGAAAGLAGNFLVEKGILSEDTRGGIAAGSTALGLGLPPQLALGIGLGKAAWDAKTPGGGALMGAGSGAAIGAMVGGPVGALIGAAIGGIAGAVKGMYNKIQGEKKKARSDAAAVVTEFKNSVFAGMLQGTGGQALTKASTEIKRQVGVYGKFKGMSDVQKKIKADEMLASGQITRADYDVIIRKQLDTYTSELEKQGTILEDAARGPITTYNNRMDELQKMTGKSREEIHKLAMENGVNLYDSTVQIADAFEKLGTAVDVTAAGIVGATRDIAVKAMGVFDEVINRKEATLVLDEAAETIRQLGTGAGKEDFAEFFRTFYSQMQILNPNATQFELIGKMQKTFGAGGTAYTQAGGPFAGLENVVTSSGGGALLNQFIAQNTAEQKGALADQIVSALSLSNLVGNRADILTQLNTMSMEQLSKIQTNIASGNLSAFADRTKSAASTQAEDALRMLGITTDVAKMAQTPAEQLSEQAATLRDEMVRGITEGFANVPEWFKTPPEWFNKESFEALTGDTHTPRGGRIGDTSTSRNLGRTMARHNYINSMVTGSRSVTSAYRTWGLGSINSDHVTGRAYDLTGQNLGMYASTVKGMGGFAEFHGVGGDRHLHVVPGPSPIGDMTTPRMASGMSTPAMASSDSITVNVYGAAGQDETVIAQKVVSLLDKRQRSVRERM